MKFSAPLIKGTLVKRYKRFLADIKLVDGSIVIAHCANSGSMLSVSDPGSEVWISPATNPDRKLRFTWELIRVGSAMVGINTNHPNKLIAEAIDDGVIKELTGYSSLKREVKYGKNSRIDILLEADNKPNCYVEIKNVTMRRNLSESTPAEFPDSITSRGKKHLMELSDMVLEGHRSVMVFLVQRDDVNKFSIAADIDPEYSETLAKAQEVGVEVICYDCVLSPETITVNRPLQIN